VNSFQSKAIVLHQRPYGEGAAILRVLTADYGVYAGYVHAGRSSKAMRAALDVGNHVDIEWISRDEEGLGRFKVELDHAYGPSLFDAPQKLLFMRSACDLIHQAAPEREALSGLYEGTIAMFDQLGGEYALPVYCMWELSLLAALGFALSLERCVVSGSTHNLHYVSPKSGCAVSKDEAGEYKDKLLVLPPFLRGDTSIAPSDQDIQDALKLSGYFLERRIFNVLNRPLPDSRLELSTSMLPQK
jgi:DNA repair protein RecO (recombination protein O)